MAEALAHPARSSGGEKLAHRAELFHPLVDFLCLGGASLIVLPLIALFLPAETSRPGLATFAVVLAHFINHPHFAHSYQIFYRNFRRKAFGAEYRAGLRARYVFAGIVVPALLAAFMAGSAISGDALALGFAANIMLFLVGWHYVKQGYGMAIVDSVLKRQFYADPEKKVLQINAYACWLVTWLSVNRMVEAHDYWGLTYYTLAVPELLWQAAIAVAVATTLATAAMLAEKWQTSGTLPINGIIAYVTTLYVWMIFARVNPLFILVIPAFHSLQYLVVVWRYQLNVEKGRPGADDKPKLAASVPFVPRNAALRFLGFSALGLALGFLGFWFAPALFDALVPYDQAVFGTSMFVFMFWVSINVHHYFLDNVMWRRENPDTRAYLFNPR